MSVTEVLQDIRGRIEGGWTQGRYSVERDGKTCYCLFGAFLAAIPEKDEAWAPVINILTNTLKATTGELMMVKFNDAPGRTQQEVLDFLDRTIEAAKKSDGSPQ